MHRLLSVLLLTTACASGPHVYADDGAPEGIPKSARAHCRSWAGELAQEAGAEGISEAIRICLDGLLRADCAEEMARTAQRLEDDGKGDATYFFRFPGVWEPADVHQQALEVAQAACSSSGLAMMKAMLLFDGIRNARGGRIPWASFGAPGPRGSMCREGCPTK